MFKVNVLTRRPKEWKNQITAYTKGSAWESKGDITGKFSHNNPDNKEIFNL